METEHGAGDSEVTFAPISTADLESIDEPSGPFVGDWHQLISTTNWDKGKIVCQWRARLQDAGVSPRLFSDPAWSQLVGEISAQHVGRLRRTFQRFGQVHGDYPGLYWSHFYAALDWDDAEMWLEGASQNRWSVAKMRFQRWHTLGAVQGDRPRISDIVSSPHDEGVALMRSPASVQDEIVRKDENLSIDGPRLERPDFGDEPGESPPSSDTTPSGRRVDVPALLQRLPDEIVVPYRRLRAAIEIQKNQGWQAVKRIDIVALLNDLRQLLRSEPGADKPQRDN